MPYKDKEKQRAYLKDYEERRREKKAQYSQQQYRDKPEIKQSVVKRQQDMREFLQQIKMGLSCKRCGIDDWRVLDFHHTNGQTKEFSIANAISRGYNKERILREVARCEVLCSNCHRILHWEERYG